MQHCGTSATSWCSPSTSSASSTPPPVRCWRASSHANATGSPRTNATKTCVWCVCVCAVCMCGVLFALCVCMYLHPIALRMEYCCVTAPQFTAAPLSLRCWFFFFSLALFFHQADAESDSPEGVSDGDDEDDVATALALSELKVHTTHSARECMCACVHVCVCICVSHKHTHGRTHARTISGSFPLTIQVERASYSLTRVHFRQ